MALLLLGVAALPVAAANAAPPHNGTEIASSMKLSGGVNQKVLSTELLTTDTRDVTVSGWIDFINSSGSSVKLTLTFFHKGKLGKSVHKEDEIVTVPAGAHVTVPVGMQCDALSMDDWEFGVFVKPTADITVATASQTAFAHRTGLPTGFAKRTSANAITLTTSPKTILQADVDFGGSSLSGAGASVVATNWRALAEGWVNVVGGSQKSTLKLDYYMDNSYMGSIDQIIGPDQPVGVPLGFQCDGAFTGMHTFTVKASAGPGGGPRVRSGFVSIAGFADGSVMPATGWDGDGQPVALTTKPQQLMKGSITTSASSDVWMGGWLTLQNTTDKKRVVTIQAAMGGEADGPALKVTVAKHGLVTVPFGLLCDLIQPGTVSLDLLVSASALGVQWTGDGHTSGWSAVGEQ